MMLKTKTVAIIKRHIKEGRTTSEINAELMRKGLIDKPISDKSISNIRTGKSHADVKPLNQYMAEQTKAQANFNDLTSRMEQQERQAFQHKLWMLGIGNLDQLIYIFTFGDSDIRWSVEDYLGDEIVMQLRETGIIPAFNKAKPKNKGWKNQ